jgi:quercetin dioxygenase-like cupin family protein
MRLVASILLLAVLVAGPAAQSTFAEDKMASAASSASKFVNLPGLPTCLQGSVQNGDPSKGASVILGKVPAGCRIPWHWHTAGEQLMFVSGQAKVEMKDGPPATLHAGSYINLPAKGVHQFTCAAACTLFIAPEGAFDIHYVDADGKEISPDDALKSKAKSKTPMKKDMKDMKDMKM